MPPTDEPRHPSAGPPPTLRSFLTQSPPCQETPPGNSTPSPQPSEIVDSSPPLPPLPDKPPEKNELPHSRHPFLGAEMRVMAIDHPVNWVERDYPDGLVPKADIVTVRMAREREHQRARTGRPTVVNEQMKYTMLELLGIGMSLRTTAAHVGVSHQTVANLLAKDAAFAEEVRRTREQAKVYPLNCILRECGRSWRAAAWLIEYMERHGQGERPALEGHLERVWEKALPLIEQDIAEKIRKQAAEQGHPWIPKPEEGGACENALGLMARLRPAAKGNEEPDRAVSQKANQPPG